jgi:outer membrane protein assembly factor BamB/tRNA A-37 threonylcarbamoyl transferase component Bud32
MTENERNSGSQPEGAEGTINLSQSNGARRKRGLSRFLDQPLSLESNVDEEEDTSSQEEHEDAQESPRRSAPAASRQEVAPETVALESKGTPPAQSADHLATRRVAGAAEDQSKGESREGLLQVGAQLQNRYKILGVIGIGGMGAVYKAQDLRFPGVMRLCAVKEMINTAADPQVRQMIIRNFEREASILATLSHPSIPQVYDYFTEGSRSYLVIEFVSGMDLEARVSEVDGFFSESLVVDWAVQLCDVLSFLHNHKPRPIIFRDLKPSNIMLDDHNRIRLVDFGIAKLFQSGEKGTMIGTEGYSPPEQYRGIAEPRGDVYALGATMHHLLSKQDPRMEPPFSFKERPIHKTNPTVSRELVEIVEKALEYDINRRWGSAEEFKRALLSTSSARGLSSGAKGETTAFAPQGALKPLWRFACEDEVRGSVTVSNDVVLVPSYDHNVYALDVEEGKFLWKYPAEGGIASSPCVSDGMVVFGSTDKVVYSVDMRSGELLWTMPTKGRVFSSAYVEFGHFFIGSDDRQLYAIQAASGRKAWDYGADAEIRARPFVTENLILFSCAAGMVYALGLNRELRWRFRSRRGILAAPVLSDGLVFIGSLDWNFYALDNRSGWSAWKYRAGGPIVSTAAVWEDLIFFGAADGYIYALEASDGRLVWRYETENQVTGSATVYEDSVYIGSVDGALYCLDARSGNLRWRYQTDGAITGAPQAADGVIYFGSADHYVYALPV